MSLRKNHLESNDYPCHRRIKKANKKIASRRLRRKTTRIKETEL